MGKRFLGRPILTTSLTSIIEIRNELLVASGDSAVGLHEEELWPRLGSDHQQPVLVRHNSVSGINSHLREQIWRVRDDHVCAGSYRIIRPEISTGM